VACETLTSSQHLVDISRSWSLVIVARLDRSVRLRLSCAFATNLAPVSSHI
jgi:hypothetical protein